MHIFFFFDGFILDLVTFPDTSRTVLVVLGHYKGNQNSNPTVLEISFYFSISVATGLFIEYSKQDWIIKIASRFFIKLIVANEHPLKVLHL